jgi:hypothetical protein
MKTTKARRKKPTPKRRYAVKPLLPFNPRHTALPDEEVQWLVTRVGVEPFVRRMVAPH